MKQLSAVLNNISYTVGKTDTAVAEQKCSLTKEDGKMIIEIVEQSKAQTPLEYTKSILTLWKQLSNLQKLPRPSFGGDGCEFPCIDCGDEVNNDSRKILGEILKTAFQPISKQEFAMLYAKLKVLCKWHSVPADEKMIMAAYYDELSKYPAILVREALKPKYEWFPSFYEMEEKIKENGEHLLLLKDVARVR